MAEAEAPQKASKVRAPQPPPRPRPVSDSLAQLERKYRKPLTAFELACALLDTHDYGGYRRRTIKVTDAPLDAERRIVADWLRDIRPLFDRLPEGRLHGRAVVLGVALLEPALYRRLAKIDGFLDRLRKETFSDGSLLSQDGTRRVNAILAPAEVVPTLRDDPASLDELGREILAEVLSARIRRVRGAGPKWVPRRRVWWAKLRRVLPGRRSGATGLEDGWDGDGKRCFLIHVDAPWGAGKTSLLRFLGRDLRRHGWAVIDFNAWEHQRIVPPWWWLMTKLHDDGIGEVAPTSTARSFLLWLQRLWWRVRDQWALFLALPLAALAAFALYRIRFFGASVAGAGEVAKSAGAILAFVLALIGAVSALNRWLVGGSDGAAASLLRRTRDPARLVKRRFSALVHGIQQPIAIFIDDLDRCKSDFVVELLEGIQTMFSDQPVVYVVAADGNWVRESYATVYKDFCTTAAEPGRPLGWLFLEKTFQERLRLPRISAATREAFWRGLLTRRHDGNGAPREQKRAARELFEGLGTPEAVGATLQRAQKEGQIPLKDLQRAASLQLETDAIEEHDRHTLDNFAHLLEDNPRAMKKLINAYGIQRHLLVFEDPDLIADEQQLRRLALWSLVWLRWPLVAEYLERQPEEVKNVAAGTIPFVEDAGIERALRERALRRVLNGTGVTPAVSLDSAAVRRFVGLEETAKEEEQTAKE